jgi:hypothetical protein
MAERIRTIDCNWLDQPLPGQVRRNLIFNKHG